MDAVNDGGGGWGVAGRRSGGMAGGLRGNLLPEWQRICRDGDKLILTSAVIYGQEVLYALPAAGRGQRARLQDVGGRAAPACCRQVGNEPPRRPVAARRRLESRKRGRGGEWVADFRGWRVGWPSLEWSFPLCGNVWFQPLDSGLRRNDEGSAVGFFFGNGKGAVRMATNSF